MWLRFATVRDRLLSCRKIEGPKEAGTGRKQNRHRFGLELLASTGLILIEVEIDSIKDVWDGFDAGLLFWNSYYRSRSISSKYFGVYYWIRALLIPCFSVLMNSVFKIRLCKQKNHHGHMLLINLKRISLYIYAASANCAAFKVKCPWIVHNVQT